MSRAQGVNTDSMVILGLLLSNGLVALSGALVGQSNGFADAGMGVGTIVIGLASVIIGEVLFGTRSFKNCLISVVLGSIVYRLVIAIVLELGMPPNDLKLFTAILVAIALSLPLIQSKLRAASRSHREGFLMLKLENVYKTFFPGSPNEKKALQGVSLTLEDGDFATVIGSNGAGKSTVLNSIAGVFPIDSGRIIIGDTDVTKMPEHKRARFIGRVFQDPMKGTAAGMQIAENLAMAMRRGQRLGLRWSESSKMYEHFREMLAELDLGLEDRLTSKVGLLSGGQRQAVTLLMATIRRPELLLLDEHTAALDPKTAEKVLAITDRFVHEGRLTTLMITHNMRDALRFGNRLIMMHNGRAIVNIAGEEKKKLTVQDLLGLFEKASNGEADIPDSMILG